MSGQRTARGRYLRGLRQSARMAAFKRLQDLHLEEYRELLVEERRLDPGSGRPYQRARNQAWTRLSKLYFLQFHRLLKEEHLARGLPAPRKPKAKMTPKRAQQTLAALACRIETGSSSDRIYPSQELMEACRIAVALLEAASLDRELEGQQTA